jgi:hypothetical protein
LFIIWNSLPPLIQYLTITTWKILFVTVGVIRWLHFSTYHFERKVVGSVMQQGRVGPNRVKSLWVSGRPLRMSAAHQKIIVPVAVNKFLFVVCATTFPDTGIGGLGRNTAASRFYDC